MWAPALACAYMCVLHVVELCVFLSLSVSTIGGVCRGACGESAAVAQFQEKDRKAVRAHILEYIYIQVL